MTQQPTTLVVISYYDRRPLHNLLQLLAGIEQYEAGERFSVCIVVNQTSDKVLELPSSSLSIRIIYRHNIGMNIGAWDYGWRENPAFERYLFLQDECRVVRPKWLLAFRKKLSERSIGMVGESVNERWSAPWDRLRETCGQTILPEHYLQGHPANRVDCYLHFLATHRIPPGGTGKHLRSLVWYLDRKTLEKIDGFPIGLNYGECIAAEISVSKKVLAIGLEITQVEKNPFYYIRHVEWNQDRPGAPFTHKPLPYHQHGTTGQENSFRDRTHLSVDPSWSYIGALVVRKIRSIWRREQE